MATTLWSRRLARLSQSHRSSYLFISCHDPINSKSREFSSVQQEDVRALQQEIHEANERHADQIRIQQTAQQGWGLYALRDFETGELVMRASAKHVGSVKCSHSVQTDWSTHVFMDLPARLVNHVCNEANVGIQKNNLGAYDFYALEKIQESQEILWDYECSEYEMEGFVCSCGRSRCRGELRGFREHAAEVIESYGEDYVAPYLLEKPS